MRKIRFPVSQIHWLIWSFLSDSHVKAVRTPIMPKPAEITVPMNKRDLKYPSGSSCKGWIGMSPEELWLCCADGLSKLAL